MTEVQHAPHDPSDAIPQSNEELQQTIAAAAGRLTAAGQLLINPEEPDCLPITHPIVRHIGFAARHLTASAHQIEISNPQRAPKSIHSLIVRPSLLHTDSSAELNPISLETELALVGYQVDITRTGSTELVTPITNGHNNGPILVSIEQRRLLVYTFPRLSRQQRRALILVSCYNLSP
jgi:hypothetical protein